jgi:hypothetical protein
LIGHVTRLHGLTVDAYRERYELARTLPLVSRATAEKLRQRALERDQGSVGREALAGIGPRDGRPKGLNNRLSSRVRRSKAGRGY